MTVLNAGSGYNFSPSLELPNTRVKSAQQREIKEKIINSLPGRSSSSGSRDIKQIASDFEFVSKTFDKKLKFVVDQNTNEVIVKVIDKATDKVIKVLPPEELQRLHRKLKETIGFLFNELA